MTTAPTLVPLGNGVRAAADLAPLLTDIDQVRPHPRNPRAGDTDTIIESIRINHVYRPVYAQRSTGRVLAGNHTYAALMELGAQRLPVVWLDVDDDAALRIMLVDNRAADRGGYDHGLLLDLLQELAQGEAALLGTGYDDDDTAHIRMLLNENLDGLERAAELDAGAQAPARPRTLPLRLILSVTSGPSHVEAQIARRMGWGMGMLTSHYKAVLLHRERFPRYPGTIAFADNPYRDYDHAKHVEALAALTPTSATTRDLFTKEQAAAEGVTWYSLDETLAQAAEVAEHVTDDVIVIPKYDCLDKIPATVAGKRVVLGYSVESSYGGTALPAKAFAGRPVHLLGGSWTKQRAYLNLLGDDVVALDNNHVLMVAQYGSWCRRDGTTATVSETLGGPTSTTFLPALCLSLVEIASACLFDYQVPMDEHITDAEFDMPDANPGVTH